MLKKKWVYGIWIAIGVCLLAGGVLARVMGLENKPLEGVLLGLGAGLLGGGAANFYMRCLQERHPEEMKRSEVDFKDERNTAIRNRAKASSSDVIQWLVMGLAWLNILIDGPLWLTIVIVGVFVAKNAMDVLFMAKYEKEM